MNFDDITEEDQIGFLASFFSEQTTNEKGEQMTWLQSQEELAAAKRRGANLIAMRKGLPLPHPQSAEADRRPGNADDEQIAAYARGKAAMQGRKQR